MDGGLPEELGASRATGKFYGPKAETWADAMRLADGGFRDAENAMRTLSGNIIPKVGKVWAEAPYFSAYPDGELDPASYCAGEPEPYICFRDEERFSHGTLKIVRVALNVAVPGATNSDVIMRRGVASMVLCEFLERSGHPVELYALHSAESSANKTCYSVRVKGAGEPLDLQALSFILAHPSFLRRLMFSLMEQESPDVRREMNIQKHGGYSAPANHPDEATFEIAVPHESGYGSSAIFGTDDKAAAWIRGTLEKIGVKLEAIGD